MLVAAILSNFFLHMTDRQDEHVEAISKTSFLKRVMLRFICVSAK